MTSRRFCEFCEVEQKEYELAPRAIMIVAVLFGAAGFTAYFGGGNATSPAQDGVKPRSHALSQTSGDEPPVLQANSNSISTATSRSREPVTGNTSRPDSVQRQAQPNSSTESVYFCGALTRKGTPCTRRVKAPGRCWQHAGQ